MRRLPRLGVLAAVVAGAVGVGVVVSSARSDPANPAPRPGRCGAVATEELDSRSLQHVFPSGPPPSFASGQPTSGPHSPVERSGVQAEPLSPALQVGLLEEGAIVLQHEGLDDAARRRLESYAGPEVIVAPGQNLPDAVVATAWTVKLRCAAVDDEALRSFIDRFKGVGSG